MSFTLRSATGVVGVTLGLAAFYFGLGMLALRLAGPGGYASPIFPAAGLALFALLLWGRMAWLGVWLGSFLLNFWVAYTASTSWSTSGVVIAGAIACGAWLQARTGEFLVCWRVPDIRQLHSTQQLFWLLLLGGPVACLVAATVGTAALHAGQVISPLEWLQSWGTWWVGDTIGVLVVSPIMLMFRPGTVPAWRRRRIAMLIMLSLTLSLVGVSVVSVNQQESIRAQADFFRRSGMVEQAIVTRLYGYEEYVNAVAQYVSVTPALDSAGFTNFVKDLYRRYPGIRAMSWVPLVLADERLAFEARYGSPQQPYRIKELDWQGEMHSAEQRERFFPVLFIAPVRGNEAAIGLDLASEPQRQSVIVRAIDDARMRATSKLHLVQMDSNKGGVLIAHPVFFADGRLRGLVTAVFSLAQMLAPAHELAVKLGIAAELRDVVSEQHATVLIERVVPLARSAPE